MKKSNSGRAIDELGKIHIDCMIGKKKHYNARGRYSSYHKKLGVSIIILSAVMGASVYKNISEIELNWLQVITGLLAVVIAVLAALQTYFNYENRAHRHQIIANKYLALMKEAQQFIAYFSDGIKTTDDVILEIKRLNQEIVNLHQDEPGTSKKDFDIALEGIKRGEENY